MFLKVIFVVIQNFAYFLFKDISKIVLFPIQLSYFEFIRSHFQKLFLTSVNIFVSKVSQDISKVCPSLLSSFLPQTFCEPIRKLVTAAIQHFSFENILRTF